MKYVEYEVPPALEQIRRIRAIASKRTEERLINHLTKEEMKGLLDAPDPRTRSGLRDQAMLYLGFAAGSGSRSSSVCAWTPSNSTGRIRASSCAARGDSNVASPCGRKRRAPFAPGWPSAEKSGSRRSS